MTRCLVAAGLSAAVLALAPADTRAQPPDPRAIDELVRDALKAWQVPGAAVAIVQGEKVVYLKGHGVREAGTRKPVTPDTVFPLASCTKTFTTTAMALLVDEGKMDWDDPVRKHVPFFRLADPLADANVTLRDLVTHRTGLAGHDLLWYRAAWDEEEAVRRLAFLEPSRSFRSAFQYQTIMFLAAGHAVGTASGGSWEDLVRKRFFGPLGMTGASFTTAAALKSADHASPHRRDGQGEVEAVPWYPFDRPNPAGSINAGARDLSKWVQFQLGDGTFRGKRLVSAAGLAETHTPQMVLRLEGPPRAENPETAQMSYGLAWVIQDYRGRLLVSHAGIIDGFRAHLTLVPQARTGIVILANLHETRMNLALSNSLVDLLLGLPYKDWNAVYARIVEQKEEDRKARLRRREASRHRRTKPSRELKAYAGVYEHPAYGKARVVLADGALAWHWSTFRAPLEHFHFDTFTAKNELLENPPVVFALGADGDVATMSALGVTFKRKAD